MSYKEKLNEFLQYCREEKKKGNRLVMDESATILAGNIAVASGWKCKECNLIRPYDRPTCPCQ